MKIINKLINEIMRAEEFNEKIYNEELLEKLGDNTVEKKFIYPGI